MRALTVRCFVILTLSFVPIMASAQTSTINGTVRDASGGVLPGVTVEAASPALIEKARAAVTDGGGNYSGEYIAFALPASDISDTGGGTRQ